MTKKHLLIILVLLFLSSCATSTIESSIGIQITPTAKQLQYQTPRPTNSITVNTQPSPTEKPTSFVDKLTPAATATPEVVETISPAPGEKLLCLEPDLSGPNIASTGTIVLTDSTQRELYLMDLETGDIRLLEKHFRDAQASPDFQWLAYLTSSNDQGSTFVIVDAAGKIVTKHLYERGFEFRWLNSEQLIQIYSSPQMDEFGEAYLLNPFENQTQIFVPDFPDIFWTDYVDWGIFYQSRAIYDPFLKMVLYPKPGADNPNALWSIEKKAVIAEFPTHNYLHGERPQWSPDGAQLAIILDTITDNSIGVGYKKDIFSISRDGTLKRLSYWSDFYSSTVIHNYSWSPDSRYIAFWFTHNWENVYADLQLAVLDTITGEVNNYCNLGVRPVGNVFHRAPVWSPDGKHLLIGVVNGATTSEDQSEIFLVDIAAPYAVKVAENAIPLGWMISSR